MEWINADNWFKALENQNPEAYVFFGHVGIYWMKYKDHWLFHFCNKETYISLN